MSFGTCAKDMRSAVLALVVQQQHVNLSRSACGLIRGISNAVTLPLPPPNSGADTPLHLIAEGTHSLPTESCGPNGAGVAVVRRWLSLQSSLLLQPTKRSFLQSSQKSQRVARASANLPAPHKNLKHGAQPVGGSTSKRMPRVPPGAVASGRQRSGSTVPAPSQSRFSPDCRRAARTVR